MSFTNFCRIIPAVVLISLAFSPPTFNIFMVNGLAFMLEFQNSGVRFSCDIRKDHETGRLIE